MIRYVVDASSMGPMLLRDEAANAIPELMRAVQRGECIVPGHWRFEVANMMLTAERRGRIEPAIAQANFADLDLMPVAIDEESLDHAFTRTSTLARTHGLTVYDAAYLELAERLDLILVSLDGKLLGAAKVLNVEAIGP